MNQNKTITQLDVATEIKDADIIPIVQDGTNKQITKELLFAGVNDSEELNKKFDAKADKATTIKGYGITDAYTKKEVDEALKNVDLTEYYTKEETDAEIVFSEEDVTDRTKMIIDDDEINNIGTEVIDSLDGNETNLSPSVRAVKNGTMQFNTQSGKEIADCNDTTLASGYYYARSTALNIPSTTDWFILVIRRNTTPITQIAYRYRNNDMYIRQYNDYGTVGWKPWRRILTEDNSHPIGSIFTTSTNKNPTEYLGGTWELIGKEFASLANGLSAAEIAETFPDTEYATCSGINFVRNGCSIEVRILLKLLKDVGETNVTLGTLVFEKLGILKFPISKYGQLIGSDSGEGIGIVNISYEGGINFIDAVTKDGNSTIKAGTSVYIDIVTPIISGYMLDTACDKFYWKRTA